MRIIFIILFVLLVSLSFAQRPQAHWDVSDSTYAEIIGILQPSWDTAHNQNNWNFIKTGGHSILHLKDSVVASATGVTIFFDNSYSQVISFGVLQDEKTTRMVQTTANFQGKAGAQYYGNGAFMAGASTGLSTLVITFTAQKSLGFEIYYNGASWTITDPYYNAINMSVSQPPTVAYSAGRLRLNNFPFNARGFATVTGFNINGIDSLVGYIPSVDNISATWLDIYWWDSKNGHKFTSATPTTFMGVYVNFGDVFELVNPITEDMGFDSNFQVYVICKK